MKKYIKFSLIALCALILAPMATHAQTSVDAEINTRTMVKPSVANSNMRMTFDLNKDGIVNGADTGLVLGAWGRCATKGGCKEDINKDGAINQTDLDLIFRNWTKFPEKKSGETSVSGTSNRPTPTATERKLEERTERVFDLKNGFEMIVKRMLAGIDALGNIATRIESRNEKLKSSGADVSASANLVAQAKVEMEAAKADLSSLPKSFDDAANKVVAATDTDSRDNFTSIREKIKSAKEHMQKAHQYLTRAVASTKTTTSASASTNSNN